MRKPVLVQFPGLGSYAGGLFAGLLADASLLGEALSDVDRAAHAYGFGAVTAILADDAGPDIEQLAGTPTLLHLCALASSYVLYQALCGKGIEVDVLLGHSTGELTALVAAGSLSLSDAARVLCEREIALAEGDFAGGLTALRTSRKRAAHLCGAAGGWTACPSLFNAPEQTVVSGIEEELVRVERLAQASGVQATRLLVRYPHHNPVLRPAARRLAAATAHYRIEDPIARVYSPILRRFVRDAHDVRRLINRHLTDPVDYMGSLRALYEDYGVREFVEVGIRPVLTESARECLPPDAALLGPPLQARDACHVLDELAAAAARDGLRSAESCRTASDTADLAVSALMPADEHSTAVPPRGATARRLPARADLVAQLRRIFAEDLGYPEEVFTNDAHLEADLGITSLKKTELFARLLDEFDLPTPPAQIRMRDYTTLPRLAELMEGLASNPEASPDGAP